MKAIILAAGSGIKMRQRNEAVPTCLMKIGKESLLRRQIKILKQCGVNEIVVIVGQKGNCWNEKIRKKIRKIIKNTIVNPINASTPSTSSLALGLSFFNPGKTIVIDGDTVFEKNVISAMVKSSKSNIVLVEKATTGIKGTFVSSRKGKVTGIGRSVKSKEIYAGLMKIDRKLYQKLSDILSRKSNLKIDYSRMLNQNLKSHPIYSMTIENVAAEAGEIFDFKPLTGGSFAYTKVINKMVDKPSRIVRKEASGEGRQKLKEEIKWIRGLPSDIKPYFPEILDYSIKGRKVWFEMRYYNLPTLRELLVNSTIGTKEALYLLNMMIKFMFSKVYSRKISKNTNDYAKSIHIDRIKDRFAFLSKKSKLMKEIISAEYIIMNGKRFYNIPTVLSWIENDEETLNRLEPPFVCMVHGDLHFDNFLVDRKDAKKPKFKLFDPRGLDNKYNYTYDLGKLWHSFHSKYDILHEGLFKIKYKFKNKNFVAKMEITDKKLLKTFRKINNGFKNVLKDIPVLKKDKNWLMRTYFSEVGHLCSVMPFHMKFDERERLAVALYLTGVKLINDFVFKYCKRKYKRKVLLTRYANINTIKDYIRAKEFFE